LFPVGSNFVEKPSRGNFCLLLVGHQRRYPLLRCIVQHKADVLVDGHDHGFNPKPVDGTQLPMVLIRLELTTLDGPNVGVYAEVKESDFLAPVHNCQLATFRIPHEICHR
jgi:hypothetical protein